MGFSDDTCLRRDAEGSFTADLPVSWSSLVGIHGGFVVAIAARAIETTVADPGRPIKSLSTQFVRSPAPGPARVEVEVQQRGRRVSFVTARMTQDDRLLLLVSAICAGRREGLAYNDLQVPHPPAPPDGLPRFTPSQVGVGHFANAELVMDPEVVTFGGGDRAWLAGWLRPLDGESVSTAWLACAADFFPPALFTRTTGPVRAASLDYSVQFLTAEPACHVPPGGFVYAEMDSAVSADGFAVEDGTIWAPDGVLLATSRQVRLAGE